MLENYAQFLSVMATIFGSVMSLGYVPQAYKIWKRKSVADISLFFFTILFVGIIIWLLYGLSIANVPLVIANTLGMIGSGSIIFLYFKYNKKGKK